uniref:Coiled-coil domain-containing protein 25 n=1 Tax=Anopheles epiroticus TaxID=199890 RepID=A0A182P903_9DIPT
MVFYFTSNVVQPPVTLFMGLDKYENEDLIRWGWPEDVWFHVNKVSSAHVYLRLQPGQTLDDIPSSVLEDACQLVKANSITGNKMNNIDIVYTMWDNLKKTAAMDVGQVAFHREKEVRMFRVEKRCNEIVNRLNKTKREESVDFRAEREKRDALERADKKRQAREQRELEKEDQKRRQEEADLRSYNSLMKPENMTSNYDAGNDSDEFIKCITDPLWNGVVRETHSHVRFYKRRETILVDGVTHIAHQSQLKCHVVHAHDAARYRFDGDNVMQATYGKAACIALDQFGRTDPPQVWLQATLHDRENALLVIAPMRTDASIQPADRPMHCFLHARCIIMSAPIAFCISMLRSGVSIHSLPSYGLWNRTPCSVISASCNNDTI